MNHALQATDNNPLEALKSQTFTLHKALEKRLAFPDTFASIGAYSQVLILFYVFQQQVAVYTDKYQAQVASQFTLPQRNRLPLIEQDMRELAMPPVSAKDFKSLQLQSLDEFYGCLYVSEGSTLGGNIIQSTMLKIHGDAALDWTHYLNPYGQQMLPMWHAFRTVLLDELACGTVNLDGVISGAVKTFQHMLDIAQQLGFTGRT